MANRRLFQFNYTYERDIVTITMKVSIGAAGAPTLVTGANKGISSVARVSAGKYNIFLQDPFNRLMDLTVDYLTASAPAAPLNYITADNSSTAGTPNVQIQLANSSGTATDPANGEILLVVMTLKNAST